MVVDDEPRLLRAIGSHLMARGYEVDMVESGEMAIARGMVGTYDVAIVDLGLPGIDGIEVVHALRGSVPMIVLSARHDEVAKIRALDAGADDYVTKPFGMGELLARLRAVLRRGQPVDEPLPPVETADFHIDFVSKRAMNAEGDEITVTPTEWHLLELLVRSPDRLVSHRELLTEVWGSAYVNQTNYVRQFMAQLRRKFEPDPARPRYFLTQPGLGVRFVPVLELDEKPIAIA
jgi:two-component system KDP operon response regulator KdpE